MNRRVAGWLAAVAALGLILGGVLVWLWMRVGGWGFPVVLAVAVAAVAAYTVRLVGLARREPAAAASVALLAVAPLLPRREALIWLPEIGGQLLEAVGEPARWRAMRSDAVRSMPALLCTAWGAWMRGWVVALAVRYARPKVVAIHQVMRSPQPPWPLDRSATYQLRQRLRTLSLCARVLVYSAGRRHQSELIGQARKLIEFCAATRREVTPTAHDHEPTARALALILEVQHLTLALAEGLTQHRRWSE